jgi:hypothetical protein
MRASRVLRTRATPLRRFWKSLAPEHINQHYVQHVPSPPGCRRASAGMKLLGNLVGETQAANWRSHWNSQFRKPLNMGINQVKRVRFSGSEIHLNCLPRAGSILNGDFDTIVSACAISRVRGLTRNVNSSKASLKTADSAFIRIVRLPSIPRSRSFVARAR